MSIHRWTDKENVVYTHTGILFSLKKEGNFTSCKQIEYLEDIVLSEVSQPQKNKYCLILLIWGIWNSQTHSPGVGNGNPLQYSCLENSMDREACWLQSMRLQRVGHNWATNAHMKQRIEWSLPDGDRKNGELLFSRYKITVMLDEYVLEIC